MNKSNLVSASLTLSLLALIAFVVSAYQTSPADAFPTQDPGTHQASLQRFTLDEMIDRAGRIFRGTVITAEPGVLDVGGAKLPTMTYRFRVDHAFKGNFENKDEAAYADVVMLGSPKGPARSGEFTKLNSIPAPTLLTVGSDHLMLLTPESSVGLTAPVGLGQGRFEIYEQDKTEFAKNEFNNLGIFDGPVTYSRLAAEIEKKGGKR